MCAYNLVNGDYSCGNDHLLNGVLKGDWAYKGWVMSDWGAVHAMDYAVKGLDQQSGEQLDDQVWFGAPLKAAVEKGEVPGRAPVGHDPPHPALDVRRRPVRRSRPRARSTIRPTPRSPARWRRKASSC
jgi:beta-glucosidase-like glycosyl hydrolase